MAGKAGNDGSTAGAPDQPEYEALRPGYWSHVGRRRCLALIVGGVLLAILATVGYVASRQGAVPDGPEGEATRTITPAEPTAEPTWTVVPTYTVPATAVPGQSGSDPGTSPDTPPGVSAPDPAAPAIVRAPLVVYRRDGWLCVAAEDGAAEVRVAESAAGAFSLSPDGRTLAFVDAASRTLVLADVGGRSSVSVGPAVAEHPSWSPDSAWLVYTAPGFEVRRVAREGVGSVSLFDGRLPSVATSGGVVVGVAPGDAPREMIVWRAGSASRVPATAPVTGVASDGTRVYYGTASAGSATASLAVVGIDGSGRTVLAADPDAPRMTAVCDLRLSPSATLIAFAECGDDGYSRTFVVPVTGGAATGLSARRDTYPLGWSAGGTRLAFVEGNAFQGEATALVTAAPDGAARARLVEGAGR